MQCHPMAANLFWSSISRSLFLRILFTQNSLFVFGILQHSESVRMYSLPSPFGEGLGVRLLCPCQKHPFTKMQSLMVQSVSEPPLPQSTAHNHLRLRILPSDRRHSFVSLLWSEFIHIVSIVTLLFDLY